MSSTGFPEGLPTFVHNYVDNSVAFWGIADRYDTQKGPDREPAPLSLRGGEDGSQPGPLHGMTERSGCTDYLW